MFHLSLFFHPCLYLRYYGHKYRDQLIGFFDDWFYSLSRSDASFDQQVQPVVGLVQFLKCGFELVDNVGIGFCPMAFTVMRPNGCARPKKLLSDHLRLRCLRQAGVKPDDPQSKLARSRPQVLRLFNAHDHSSFIFHPFNSLSQSPSPTPHQSASGYRKSCGTSHPPG
jgi:hypothetical protein